MAQKREATVKCPYCANRIPDASKFCPECGRSMADGPSYSGNINTSAHNQIGGHFIQGNAGSIIINAPETGTSVPSAEAVPVWRSPITQSILGWIGTITGVLSLFPLGTFLLNIYRSFQHWENSISTTGYGYTENTMAIVFVVLLFLSCMSFILFKIAKHELTYPVMFGYGISGVGKRLSLVRIKSTPCPQCEGRLRYRNLPTKTRIITYSDGSSKETVAEKRPFLVCENNPDHRWSVDPTLFSNH